MEGVADRTEELVQETLRVAREKLTGTLVVSDGGERFKHVITLQGCVVDLDTGRDDTVLVAALLASGVFAEKDVKRAKKLVQKSGQTLGAGLLELGIASEETVAEAIRARLTEEFCEVFQWPPAGVEFIEHQADERLEGSRSELSDFYEVLADPEDMVLEAARRIERWDLIESNFPVLLDVYYATPASFRYFREQGQYVTEHAVLSKVDGVKDVSEVIEDSGVDPFAVVSLVRALKLRGELELINPVQMYQLGVEFAQSGNSLKASKLLYRAHERGLDDFDIQLKLARALENLDRKDEAASRYVEFGEKCVKQTRIEDAIRAFRKAQEARPNDLTLRMRLFDILLEQGRSGDAFEEGTRLAEYLEERGSPKEGLDVLVRVRSLHPRDLKLQQRIIELAEACQDFEMARSERELLAKNSSERKDIEVALDTYQRMFCEGNDSLEVRLKLVELHRAKGNRSKALDHIHSILSLPEKRRPQEEAVLVSLHEAVRELKPGDLRSNRWLIDYYLKKGEKDKAVLVLSTWIARLTEEGDIQEAVHAQERLILIDDDYEHRWSLSKNLEKLGRTAECRRELRSLANLALRKKEFDTAARALDYVLKTAPLDMETRRMQADLFDAKNEVEAAARKFEEIALLDILSGNVQEGEQYCRRLSPARATTPEIIHRLGKLCLEQGDRQKAAEQLLKAAKCHFQHRNYGLCRTTVEDLLIVEPGNVEGMAVLGDLKAVDGAPSSPAGTVPTHPAPVHTATSAPPQASPQPSTPLQPGATAEDGRIFEPPSIHKTTVAGITSKLKRLKSAPLPGTSASVTNSEAVPETGPEARPEPDAPRRPEGAGRVLSSNTALHSAASRLKALAGRKAQEASHPEELAEGPVPSAETPPVERGEEAKAAPQAPTAAATAPGKEQEPSPTQPLASAVVRTPKLSSAASRLAALREKATAQT